MLNARSFRFRTEMKAALFLLFSFLAVLTVWLILPIFIFRPLAIYFGWKSCKQARVHLPQMRVHRRLLALAPLLIATVTMPGMMVVVSSGYRA